LGVLSFTAVLFALDVPRLGLKVKDRVTVDPGSIGTLATIGSPLCDGEGNVYYHLAMPAPADPRSGPVVRVSADGKHVAKLGLREVPDLPRDANIETLVPGLRGEFHIVASGGDDLYLVNFDDEGKFSSLVTIEAHFALAQVAIFATGEFLASGEKIPAKGDNRAGVPFTAIFDRNGRLIRELSAANPVGPEGALKATEQRSAISLGETVSADDGNVYVLRASKRPLVIVISPGGEIVRRLQLSPPDEGLRSISMKVAGGKIVLSFFKPNNDKRNSGTYIYSLYDAETGERQIDYEPAADVAGIFACYAPNEFTFLDVTETGLSIVHAVPR
jgi:hypothetical protein